MPKGPKKDPFKIFLRQVKKTKKPNPEIQLFPEEGNNVSDWKKHYVDYYTPSNERVTTPFEYNSGKRLNRKGKKLKNTCSICGKSPLAGYGFCKLCWNRLRYRIKCVFKAQNKDPKDYPHEVHRMMAEYQRIAEKECNILVLRGHGRKLSCIRCHSKLSLARGLCVTCYHYYRRKIQEGYFTWDDLEKAGRILKERKKGRIEACRKQFTKPKFEFDDSYSDLDDPDD